MKFGIMSDIHGNLLALKTVLKEFEKINVDKIICCGDMIGIGPWPDEVVKELMLMGEKIIAVRGNHEQYLLNGLPKKVHNDKRKMSLEEIQHHEWTKRQISDSSRRYIMNLPLENNIVIENKSIHIVHYPMLDNGEYKKHIKYPSNSEIYEMFNPTVADIFLYGHTHATYISNYDDRIYINPGSLGCPMNEEYANCGTLEIGKGNVKFEFINVKYDVSKVVRDIRLRKYPAYEGMIDIFYGGSIS